MRKTLFKILRSLAVCLLFVSLTGVRFANGQDLVSQDSCSFPASDWFSPSEKWAWKKICQGKTADMSQAPGGNPEISCDSFSEGNWPLNRNLSAHFVKTIVTQTAFVDSMASRIVKIECARIEGQLDVQNENLELSLWVDKSRLPNGAVFNYTNVEGTLTFDHSNFFESAFDARAAHIRDRLGLWGAHIQSVDVSRLRVGVLSAQGTKIDRFVASDVRVDHNILLGEIDNNPSEINFLNLNDAKISQNLSLNGAILNYQMTGNRLKTGAGVYAQGLIAPQGLYLRNATIGEDVVLTQSSLGPVVLRGAKIGGNFVLNWSEDDTLWWQDHAYLDLRNASVSGIAGFSEDSWTIPRTTDLFPSALTEGSSDTLDATNRPLPTDLSGLTYDTLMVVPSYPAPNDNIQLAPIVAMPEVVPRTEKLLEWVEGPNIDGSDHHLTFNPQPYQQLADTLRKMGAETAAKEVDYFRYVHRMYTRKNTFWEWIGWCSDWLYWGLTWFGTYPFLPLAWFGGIVIVGTIAGYYRNHQLSKAGDADTKVVHTPFWYSLENALPLLELSSEYRDFVHTGWALYFFHIQKIIGFILATVLVGALSLVSS